MACIVNSEWYPTKKRLKEVLEQTDKDVAIEDPSFTNPRTFFSSEIKEGESVIVTNHPKRSYFAKIIKKDGKLKVL